MTGQYSHVLYIHTLYYYAGVYFLSADVYCALKVADQGLALKKQSKLYSKPWFQPVACSLMGPSSLPSSALGTR